MKIKKFGFTLAGATHVDLLPTNAKAGFTLAEILITLGIIGIISAMTIPALMTKIRTVKTEAILKEDFSILNQMLLTANDNGGINVPTQGNQLKFVKPWFETYFQPYIKTTNVCYDTDHTGCWYNKKGCGTATISFTLPNGSSVCFDDYGASPILSNYGVKTTSPMTYVFYIDTNGTKLPNKHGVDLFTAVFKEENANLVPAGEDMSEEEIEKNCKLSGTRYWCLALIKRRGWKIPELK